jgi:phage-related protein
VAQDDVPEAPLPHRRRSQRNRLFNRACPIDFYIRTDISRHEAVSFLGDSLDALRAFPASARRAAGFQIDRVQRGLDPDDWKPMQTVGVGVREIPLRDAAGAFRVMYIATLADAVYVLHAFQKKTAATSKRDLELARTRFKELMRRGKR